MTIPANLPPQGEPERVDNSNALYRALVEHLIAETGADVAPVVESMVADGRLTAESATTMIGKGWISRKRVDDAVKAIQTAREAANVLIRDAEQAARDNADNL